MTNAQAFQRATNKFRRGQEVMGGIVADGWPGDATEQRYIFLRQRALQDPDGEWLPDEEFQVVGDGTWPWSAWAVGDDIMIRNARATCFGGSNDPDDSGETASGISTRTNPNLAAVALPMDGRSFRGMTSAEHRALDGSPIPRLGEWPKNALSTRVVLTKGSIVIEVPVIDLGPGKRTATPVDLTIAAARKFNPTATASNFSTVLDSVRIIGAREFLA